MPAYITELGPNISLITLAPHEEFAAVTKEVLPAYDRLIEKERTSGNLSVDQISEVTKCQEKAHKIINDWASGKRETLKGFFGWVDSSLYRLPESPEKKDIMNSLLPAAVNTFGLT